MRRLLWKLWWAGAAFFLCLVACLGWALSFWANSGRPAFNDIIADRRTDSTKIAVFGDTQKGLAGFASLAEIAKQERVDLAIHTGDLVSHADTGHYDLALKWVQDARLGVPFVVTPGNHDIKGGGGLFERRIGPRQFAFRWGPVDVIVVDNAVAPPGEAAVRRLLEAAKGPILLFMHVPPIDTTKKTVVAKPLYNCFLEMLRAFPVRYVFSGHAHGYTRIEDDGLVFISNGVGGDSDSWQFDQKAHLTIVEATATGITAREISIDPVIGLRANVEHLAIGHVGEILLRTLWGPPAFLLLILLLIYSCRKMWKKKVVVEVEEKPPMRFTPAKTSEPPDVVI